MAVLGIQTWTPDSIEGSHRVFRATQGPGTLAGGTPVNGTLFTADVLLDARRQALVARRSIVSCPPPSVHAPHKAHGRAHGQRSCGGLWPLRLSRARRRIFQLVPERL